MGNNITTSTEETRIEADVKQKSISVKKAVWPKLLLFVLVVIYLAISSGKSVKEEKHDNTTHTSSCSKNRNCITDECFKVYLDKMIKIRNETYFSKQD